MRVQVVKTAPRCKLCQRHDRAEIDDLLLKRSTRQRTESDEPINLEYVLRRFAEMGVENPTEDNIKGHLKNHTRFIDDVEAAADDARDAEMERQAMEIFERILGADWQNVTPTPDQLLELQRSLYVHQTFLELRDGKVAPITHDQVLKSIAEQSRRKQDEAVRELMSGVGGAIAGAFLDRARETKQLEPAGPVEIEAEAVEVQ